MAVLKIISETGMFHSACCCTYSEPSTESWYGFLPAVHRRPVSKGKVDFADRSDKINHYITFEVNEGRLKKAVKATVAEYAEKDYILMVSDCVSFSADLARRCRLKVPRVNMTPYGFIEVLSWWNDYIKYE
ncbi:MAG: hypothetical protein KDA96_11130 [Planctomycetaceae bacterium]|nr:hypothetical protein [Planctomycetaceae bacterium]